MLRVNMMYFGKVLRVIIIVCTITSLIYTYKHYFDNDGKGVDDIFYLASISTLHCIFGLMAVLNYNISRIVAKKWLFIGLIYCVLVGIYVELELPYNGGSVVCIIPAIGYLAGLFLIDNKYFLQSLRVVFTLSFITSVLPVYALATLIFSLVINLIMGNE